MYYTINGAETGYRRMKIKKTREKKVWMRIRWMEG